MAGHSPTPQARKLGLKPGLRLAVVGAPAGWALSEPPPELQFVAPPEPADVVLAFVGAAAELRERIGEWGRWIFPGGALWIAWPRTAAGHQSDVTENGIRAVVLPRGLVDVKVAAIDDDWSGLKIVWRRAHRS